MRVSALIFSVLFLIGAAAHGQTRPDAPIEIRVVSTSLCGDTYVLDMVPRTYITALSWQSGHALSLAPVELTQKPKAWDDFERLLALKPTHIVFGPGEGYAARPLLEQAGIETVELKWSEDAIGVRENREKIAQALNTKFEYQRPTSPIFVNSPDVLYLSRAGGTAGPGTYVDAAINDAGGINVVKTAGWHTPDPELLAGLHPDLIVTSFFEQGYESVNAQGARHNLLQDKLSTIPSVNVPGSLWPCAGPGLEQATRIISDAIESLNP